MYLRFKIKDMLTNPELLGWGIGFVEFWVFMWLFVFSPAKVEAGWIEYFVQGNAAMAFGFLSLLSIASIGISLAYGFLYVSRSARYITKFTKISPSIFLLEDFLGGLTALLIIVSVIYLSIVFGSYFRWGILPTLENPLGVAVDLVLAGITMYWFSYMLVLLLIVARRTGSLTIASYLPLILAFIAYSQLWVNLGDLAYVIPFCSIPALMMYHATGAIPPKGSYLRRFYTRSLSQPIDLKFAVISTLLWLAIFIAVSLILLRKSRGVPIEEIRR